VRKFQRHFSQVCVNSTACFFRCEHLVQQNHLLRKQLEESHRLNEAVTNDLQKITNDWEGLRDEITVKEDEWKEEEQVR
jgi:rootletin